MTSSLSLHRAAALGAALLAAACSRGPDVPPLVCPSGSEVQVVQYPDERGGGRGERCVLPGGTREGPSYDYYADGSIHSITNWSNGERHGKTEIWHPNGVKAEEFEHSHFMPVGTWTKWDEEGRLVSQTDLGREAEQVAPPGASAPGAEGSPPPAPPAPGS
jgi:hypothetical protein